VTDVRVEDEAMTVGGDPSEAWGLADPELETGIDVIWCHCWSSDTPIFKWLMSYDAKPKWLGY
jgi:hypothetical protein